MGLAGGSEIRLDAEMEGHRPRSEPAPAPAGHRFGLGDPGKAQEAGVEGLGVGFPPRGHGQLDVVQPYNLVTHGDLPRDVAGPAGARWALATAGGAMTWQWAHRTASLPHDMGSLIKKRRKRMRKKKHKKMLKATRWQRRAGK